VTEGKTELPRASISFKIQEIGGDLYEARSSHLKEEKKKHLGKKKSP